MSHPSAVSETQAIQQPGREGKTWFTLFIVLCWVQGLYYLLTGLWPIFSIDTFQMVTGPKNDLWLVQTVGALITVIAVVILLAAILRRPSLEVALLAILAAIALTAVDFIFVLQDVIPPIYLVDAVIEIILLTVWAFVAILRRPVQGRGIGGKGSR
jgi:hypothetical protein